MAWHGMACALLQAIYPILQDIAAQAAVEAQAAAQAEAEADSGTASGSGSGGGGGGGSGSGGGGGCGGGAVDSPLVRCPQPTRHANVFSILNLFRPASGTARNPVAAIIAAAAGTEMVTVQRRPIRLYRT